MAFIRRNGGIQKIATAPASQPAPDTEESQPGKGTRRKQLAPTSEAPPAFLAPYFRFPRLPDGAWYSNAWLADKAAEVLLAAQSERQKVELRMYVHRDDWVVVGISSTPYEGPTPVPDQMVWPQAVEGGLHRPPSLIRPASLISPVGSPSCLRERRGPDARHKPFTATSNPVTTVLDATKTRASPPAARTAMAAQ
jgi:hypothetical protein